MDNISSNQIIEVGLLKPRCACFKGNSLNDWIKWLAEEQCSIDWSEFDITCLTNYVNECQTCTQDEKQVINIFNQTLCKLISEVSTLKTGATGLVKTTITDGNLSGTWKTYTGSQIIKVKQGKLITLSGLVNLGTSGTTIYTLPADERPPVDMVFLGAYSASPWFCLINVLNTGQVQLIVPGVSTTISIGNYISLDVQFYTN